MIKEILRKQEEKENKRLLGVMPLYVSAMCLKNFGFRMYKHTHGKKKRGIYIYPTESNWINKESVFLSLDTFKGKYTDDEMEQIVVSLVNSLDIQPIKQVK